MDEYDIGKAFEAIEEELISSMIRNMERHKAEETDMGIEWSQWQVEQLKSLEQYKIRNQKKYKSQFADINRQIDALIRTARESGGMDQEIEILKAIQNGFKGYKKSGDAMTAQFFRTNDRKLEALIKATMDDMKKAETAILRMANDKYRQVIFNAQVYANTGAGTYEKAVDMATKDMLSAGLNCVEYSNGARHTLADYVDMAIRTACKRAYLTGEGEKRKEWGISTVIMNKRGNPCPKCLPWVGRVMIDDVWSGGKPSDGKYPLMSTAVAAGLYHPRCRDSHTTYFDGISTPPDSKYTDRELDRIAEDYREKQEEKYVKKQEEKYGRLERHSLDADNQKIYATRRDEWKKRQAEREASIREDIIVRIRNCGVEVDISESGKYSNIARQNLERLEMLMQEYNTTLVSYKVIVSNSLTEGGSALMMNGRTGIQISSGKLRKNPAIDELKLGDNQVYCATYHEFAHSLSQSREKANPEFWREIRKIRKEYRAKRGNVDWLDVKISDYADKDIDEFFAEAFAQAKLSEKPSEYSKRVLEITDKYFGKSIVNHSNPDIIEMYRKGHPHRKKSAAGEMIIDKATYHKITNPAIKKGADIRIAEGEILERLNQQNASAVTYGDIIFFRKDATISDVLEEVHHFYQNKSGLNSGYRNKQRIILNEIEAKEYVLSMSDKYHIPEEEIKLTKNQLESYKKEMNEMKKEGEWID